MQMQVITEDLVFNLAEDESLLDGLERTGHHIEYQCRSGYCGACRVAVVTGSVSYDKQPLAFVADNEILPCCCRVEEPLKLKVQLRSKL